MRVKILIILIAMASVAAFSCPAFAKNQEISPVDMYSSEGIANLPNGGTLEWADLAGEGTLETSIRFFDQAGLEVRSIQIWGQMDPRTQAVSHVLSIDGTTLIIDPSSNEMGLEVAAFLAAVRSEFLLEHLEDALLVLPANSNVRNAVAAIFSAVLRDDSDMEGQVVSSYPDCYVDCVEDERERCQRDCDSRSPWNPCVSLCYISISLGCSIGC